MMKACNSFRRNPCHTTFAMLIVLIVNGLAIIDTGHAYNVPAANDLHTLHNNKHHSVNAGMSPSTTQIPTTSTIRPWPSDRFFRKVLRSNHKNASEMVRRRPIKRRTIQRHENTQKLSWSHYHAKHDTNLTDNKLNINPLNDESRLTNQTNLDHKNQSIDNMQSHQNNRPQVDETQEPKISSSHRQYNFSVINENPGDINEGKNMPGREGFLKEHDDKNDAQSPKVPDQHKSVNYEMPAIPNNYGIGFQYEIVPYQTHSQFTPSKISKISLPTTTPRITSTSMISTKKPTPSTESSITHLPQNEGVEAEKISPENTQTRSNSWKKIPTLTVTIRPLGELYPSNPHPTKRTKTKRPHWGFGSTHKTPSTHAHFPYPFKTRITTAPPPSVTFAQLEFDTPASPSPTTFIESPTTPHDPGFDFDANFGFSPLLPSPFSPIATELPHHPQQHVHIRPHFETHHQSQINPSEISAIQSSSSTSSLTRPFTNIWYKPIINHFMSTTANNDPVGTATNDFPSGLIFKVWNYSKNGKLTLVNENVIPPSALEGFQLEDGAILNFDQIPYSVQDTVASAILEFNQNQENLQPFDGPEYGFESSLKASGGGGSDGHQIEHSHNTKLPLDRKYVNYVIVEKRTNSPGIGSITKLQANKLHGADTQLHRHELLESNPWQAHRSTTSRPQVVDPKEPVPPTSVDQSWQQLHNLLLSVKDIQLPTPVERDSVSSPPPRKPLTDSLQTEQVGNKQLMADMAAFAILISYLKNRTYTSPHHKLPPPPLNDTPSLSSKEEMSDNDITSTQNTNALQIFQYLIQQMKNQTDSARKTPTTEPPDPENPQKDKSMLAIKGLAKTGKKKKKIKKKVSKLTKPLAHIFKKPKDYWFDVKFDLDLYDILKKKFLYYLALKYMPVALVIALKLVPLALLMIPILWKIYWVKKRPKYIRVPVPYPVYKYKYLKPPPHHHPDFEGSNNRPVSISRPHDAKFYSESVFPNNPYHHPPPPPIVLKTSSLGPHPIDLQNVVNRHNNLHLRPQTVTHAYELGFDLGSKLNTMTNNHDQQVLQILIDSRKDKIKGLLKKWELLRKGSPSTTPIHRLGHFDSKISRLENLENNEIPLDDTTPKKENHFVKKRRKKRK